MKSIFKSKYVMASLLLITVQLTQSMEPRKRTKIVTISPSAPYALSIELREMIAGIPRLNTQLMACNYAAGINPEAQRLFKQSPNTIIHSYFQKFGTTLRSISAIIESGVFIPGATHADLIRNRHIGDYLYEIAQLNGHDRTMAWLLEQGLANPRRQFFQGSFYSALNSRNFQPAYAAFWLNQGARVDLQDAHGMSALIRRAQLAGNTDMEQMRFLLEHGANPNLQNNNGDTALHFALHSPEKVALLLAHGARIDIVNNSGQTLQDLFDALPLAARKALLQAHLIEKLGITTSLSQES